MYKNLYVFALLLLGTLHAQAQFYHAGLIRNSNVISDAQKQFVNATNGIYKGYDSGSFLHMGPSAATFVNHGIYEAIDTHTDKFLGPQKLAGDQEISGTVAPLFQNLEFDNGDDQKIIITNARGIIVKSVLTFNSGIVTTIIDSIDTGGIQLENGASYAGEMGDGRHVNGYVVKTGNAAFTFPVGNSTAYLPVAISAPSAATDKFAVSWLQGDPSTTGDPSNDGAVHSRESFDKAAISSVYDLGQWDWIELSGAGNGLTLEVGLPDLTGFSTAENLRLVGWDGTRWINLSTGAAPYLGGTSFSTGDTAHATLRGTMQANISAIAIGTFGSGSIAGNVFDDKNGLVDLIVNNPDNRILNGDDIDPEADGAQPIYVSLIQDGDLIANVPVAQDGTYMFEDVVAGVYDLVINNTQNPADPAVAALPVNWVHTGEHNGDEAGDDGQPDGILSVTLDQEPITMANFGIDKRPVADTITLAAIRNPGAGIQAQLPDSAFIGRDLEDGDYPVGLAARKVTLNPATGGTLYYDAVAVAASTEIASFDPTKVTLSPAENGEASASFDFRVKDDADVDSEFAKVVIPFTPALIKIAGIVVNDANGNEDEDVNGPPVNGPALPSEAATIPLYVSLLEDGNVIGSEPVDPQGGFEFNDVAGDKSHQIVLTIVKDGNEPALPSNWVSTGEKLGTEPGQDGNADGTVDVPVTDENVTDVTLGINRIPVVLPATLPAQPNPGGTTKVAVPPLVFNGSDPEDGAYTNNLSGRKVTLLPPVNASLFYDDIIVATAREIPDFDPSAVKIDPVATGETSGADPSFEYFVKDNAGVPSGAKKITVPFTDDDDDDNEEKDRGEIPEDTFEDIIPSLQPPLVLPGLIIVIIIVDLPEGVDKLVVGGKEYTKDSPEFTGDNPPGVEVKADENGKLLEDVLVEYEDGQEDLEVDFKVKDDQGNVSRPAVVIISPVALPVKLIHFFAQKENTVVNLTWATSEEVNSADFAVQHSENGKDWKTIGTLSAAGESKATTHYEYVHSNPVPGRNYYRLQMLDKDGSGTYSQIRHVYLGFDAVYIYPNPASSYLKVTIDKAHDLQSCMIYDNKGNVVLWADSIDPKGLSLSGLQTGMYVIKLIYRNQPVKTQSFLIVK